MKRDLGVHPGFPPPVEPEAEDEEDEANLRSGEEKLVRGDDFNDVDLASDDEVNERDKPRREAMGRVERERKGAALRERRWPVVNARGLWKRMFGTILNIISFRVWQ